ncbi:hypothetical protein AHAS_Ahas18G0150600 [Arachis hypogaea]
MLPVRRACKRYFQSIVKLDHKCRLLSCTLSLNNPKSIETSNENITIVIMAMSSKITMKLLIQMEMMMKLMIHWRQMSTIRKTLSTIGFSITE